jgi:8-amino-7-oxononanoate synthase
MLLDRFENQLNELRQSSNLRTLPPDGAADVVDLSTNDYLGLAQRTDLLEQFYTTVDLHHLMLTSSASRLLASVQDVYAELEQLLSVWYGGREALMFNSGYHANTGIVSALADSHTMILADRLVHASIIDGIVLSKAPFTRFRHNDYAHLQQLIEKYRNDYDTILVITESVFSMDGDGADLERLIDIKRSCDKIMLYVDEAHAVGVLGPAGAGLAAATSAPTEFDIIVGTLGKALASAGAYCITSPLLKNYLINRARSFIFSTALAPVNAAWSKFIIERVAGMDTERRRVRQLSVELNKAISVVTSTTGIVSHIQPLVVGDAAKTVALSRRLMQDGVKVLPIRTPTVPPGTERLRFSLSAALTDEQMLRVVKTLNSFEL